jgi:hypothetical protein
LIKPGNTKRGSTIDLLFDWFVLIVSCHTADSKPVKQEVNGTVILPPLVFPGQTLQLILPQRRRRIKKRFPTSALTDFVAAPPRRPSGVDGDGVVGLAQVEHRLPRFLRRRRCLVRRAQRRNQDGERPGFNVI